MDYGHVHNVDRLIQHMLEQFLNKSTTCLTWQNELTFYIYSIVTKHIVGLTKWRRSVMAHFHWIKMSWERDNYVVGTRYYVVGTR